MELNAYHNFIYVRFNTTKCHAFILYPNFTELFRHSGDSSIVQFMNGEN